MSVAELESQGLLPRSRWSRRGFFMTSLATGFALSVQPVAAQSVITTDTAGLDAAEVKMPVKGGEMPAYRAMPDKGGPFPTVLVVQEIFGVHEHIRDLCRRLAKAGYFAIAPELYARQGNPAQIADREQLMKLVASVPDEQVLADLDAATAYAKSTGKADAAKLAVTGFCYGGRITWLYAAHNPGLKAGVAWYGVIERPRTENNPKHPIDIAAELKAPVLGLYGAADQGIPVDTVEKMAAACKSAGKTCEIKIYADTPHGFNADYRPSYRAENAKDGWARMLAWFKQHGAA